MQWEGYVETRGARLDVEDTSSDVSVTDSTFDECGQGRWCIQPGGTHLTIARNDFKLCVDCDFIRGGGSDVTITDNNFELATQGAEYCKGGICNHNDFIQVMAGGPWEIARNKFGDHDHGAAGIWMKPGDRNGTNPIHDVTIESNLFWDRTTRFVYAVRIADDPGLVGMPTNVTIVNNTFLSGRVSAVRLGAPYALLPLEQRPLVANNVMQNFAERNCAFGRYDSNLVVHGRKCLADDAHGPANLDPTGAPTPASTLVIDDADTAFAPPTDFFGHARDGLPDRGAIEYDGVR
jgi:hypothetical protein